MARWRGNTTERLYGYLHQCRRQHALAAFVPGQPCARCTRPLHNWPHQRNQYGRWTCDICDLGHQDGTHKTVYAGLEHRSCNRSAGTRLRNRRQKAMRTRSVMTVTVHTPSRQW